MKPPRYCLYDRCARLLTYKHRTKKYCSVRCRTKERYSRLRLSHIARCRAYYTEHAEEIKARRRAAWAARKTPDEILLQEFVRFARRKPFWDAYRAFADITRPERMTLQLKEDVPKPSAK